jgi:hypothetical protein
MDFLKKFSIDLQEDMEATYKDFVFEGHWESDKGIFGETNDEYFYSVACKPNFSY